MCLRKSVSMAGVVLKRDDKRRDGEILFDFRDHCARLSPLSRAEKFRVLGWVARPRTSPLHLSMHAHDVCSRERDDDEDLQCVLLRRLSDEEDERRSGRDGGVCDQFARPW